MCESHEAETLTDLRGRDTADTRGHLQSQYPYPTPASRTEITSTVYMNTVFNEPERDADRPSIPTPSIERVPTCRSTRKTRGRDPGDAPLPPFLEPV